MNIRSKKGFTLMEVLIAVGIFAITGGMMASILLISAQSNQHNTASSEVTSQLNFVMQTVGRLVRESSNIEIDSNSSTSTLKLRMSDPTKDPTILTVSNQAITLQEGTSSASLITNDKVVVDSLSFTRQSQYPGHDTVSVDLGMSFNTANPKTKVSRTLNSAIARVSAATFDSDLVPGGSYNYNVGQSGSPWQRAFLSSGTAANPSYTFSSSTGMGLFRVVTTTDILGFSTAGAERMRIDAGGNVTITGRTLQLSNDYPVYRWYFGGSQDLNWKKIADIALPVGTYKATAFEVHITNANCNYGCSSDVINLKYYASCYRSGGVENDHDNATVSGPIADYVRIVKTALGVYELQVRQLADWKHMEATAQVISASSSNTVTYAASPANGSTTGTIYTATATHTNYFTKASIQADGVWTDSSSGAFRISGITNPNYRLHMGYDTTNNFGWINAIESGVAGKSLILNPSGGNVGVGTTTPGSKLTVAGIIESTTGGIKFPDDSTQITSATMNVVSTELTNVFSTTSTVWIDVPDFNATITPSSASNKVLVTANVAAGMGGAYTGYYRILRGATPIAVPPDVAGYKSVSSAGFYDGSSDANTSKESTAVFLDSPNTTSAVTYKIQVYTQAGTMRVNALGSDISGQTYSARLRSSLTLMEIK